MRYPIGRHVKDDRCTMRQAIALSALLFVEALDVGSDGINFLGTQNDIGHAGVRGPEKHFYGKLTR
jgi:hypothetical protein